eukprot:2567223-Pyramimonas_sp.AAC.1
MTTQRGPWPSQRIAWPNEGARQARRSPDELQPFAAGAHRQPRHQVGHPPQHGAAGWSIHDRLRGA